MKQYTEIPDTSDLEYWELKNDNQKDRSKVFVPKDKELHHRLKAEAWAAIQASQARRALIDKPKHKR